MEVLVAELDPTGANLLFSTRIGSGGLDTASPAGLAVDSAGNIYLAGNNDRPGPDHDSRRIPDDLQRQPGCCYHGFVAKIAPTAAPVATLAAKAASVAARAGSGSVPVSADAGSAWTACSDASWITIASGASGAGSGKRELYCGG